MDKKLKVCKNIDKTNCSLTFQFVLVHLSGTAYALLSFNGANEAYHCKFGPKLELSHEHSSFGKTTKYPYKFIHLNHP